MYLYLLDHFVFLINFQVIEFVASLDFSFKRGSDSDSNPDFVVLIRSLQAPHFIKLCLFFLSVGLSMEFDLR